MLLPLFKLLARLSLARLQSLGRLLGELIYRASPRLRQQVRLHLQHARVYAPALALESVRQSGAALAELPHLWTRSPAQLLALCQAHGWEALQLARAEQPGRALLVLAPHMGSFEMAGRFIAAHTPITCLYRPARHAPLEQLLQCYRQTERLAVVPTNQTGVRELLKVLRAGGVVGLLPDQTPNFGEGVWVDWFGHPAYSMVLPARLALRTGAQLVTVVALRRPHGAGFEIFFEPLPCEDVQDEVALSERIQAAVQALALRYPEQYLWSYNRYKVPGQAAPRPEVRPSASGHAAHTQP